MSIPDGYTGETDTARVDVEVMTDVDEAELPFIEVTLSDVFGDDGTERSITLTMDEARHVVAGIAAVLR